VRESDDVFTRFSLFAGMYTCVCVYLCCLCIFVYVFMYAPTADMIGRCSSKEAGPTLRFLSPPAVHKRPPEHTDALNTALVPCA
jgi:hypothetical protein